MAHHDQKIATMLGDTLHVLGGGSPETTTDEGVNTVQEWIAIVRSNVSTQWVAEPLEKLRDAINANNINQTESLMLDLSGITVDLANNAAEGEYKQELRDLSTALKDFARALTK